MKLIVGLGNPGTKYVHTRHNLGFLVVDGLAVRMGTVFSREKYDGLLAETVHNGERVRLLKPQTFMNRSGSSVAQAARNGIDELENLLIVFDDANLPLGRLRFRPAGSAGGHNGLESVIEHIGTEQFPRLRLGVGMQPPGVPLEKYVLGSFRPEERPIVTAMVDEAVAGILAFLEQGMGQAMNRFNRDVAPGTTGDGGAVEQETK